VSAGTRHRSDSSPATIGLTLVEGKTTLEILQHHLVQMQAVAFCGGRRLCPRCGVSRPIKDRRSRTPMTLFRDVRVDAPRFAPCRCGVVSRRTISPLAELMPDRCTPEYEYILARMGALLPYARAVALMREFLPLGDIPAIETVRRRTLKVGARLERAALRSGPTAVSEAKTVAVAVDGGHVKSVP
jgi:hypothetical protein